MCLQESTNALNGCYLHLDIGTLIRNTLLKHPFSKGSFNKKEVLLSEYCENRCIIDSIFLVSMSKLRSPSCWWTPDGAARTARSSPGKLWSTFHCRNLYSTRSRRCCLFCFLHLHLIDTIPQANLMEKSAFNNSFYYQLQCNARW